MTNYITMLLDPLSLLIAQVTFGFMLGASLGVVVHGKKPTVLRVTLLTLIILVCNWSFFNVLSLLATKHH